MRKRCRRRVMGPMCSPWLLPPGRLADADLIGIRVRELLSFDALARRRGCRIDLRDLLVSAAVARELARLGYGGADDDLACMDAAGEALQAAKRLPPGWMGLDTAEAGQAVRRLLIFHDAQRAAASCRDYCRALARVYAEPSRFGIWSA